VKISFVNNNYRLGGAEIVAEQLRKGLQAKGHDSIIYIASGKTYPLDPGLRSLYPKLLSRLYHTRFHQVIEYWFPRAQWTDRNFRALGTSNAEVIHVHNFHGDYASIESLVAVAQRKTVVWTFHGYWGITGGCDFPQNCRRYEQTCGQCPQVGQWAVGPVDQTTAQLRKKIEQLAPLPLHIVAPSRHVATTVRESQVGRQWRVHHIPNGVDSAKFDPDHRRDPGFRRGLGLSPTQTAVLAMASDFKDARKGSPILLEALRGIPPAQIQVVLVGANSEWAAAQLPAQLMVISAGYVRERSAVIRWHESADIFLFASTAENFPCVVLEAMAAACCVVATPTEGVDEQIQNGVSGVLSAEISGPSLACALKATLTRLDQCSKYGNAARQRIENEFSEDLMIQRHLRLYESMV